ncbi:acyl-CoA dehydrogenase [Amylibacter ulvae]|uniref:Acyl-CoA dehydrogenase n=1 Tax=Paramylibacter ulvae TaxID=1651968 RepID=A0ABQ3CU15_9RHOB|nr:acyl-CoA dehydrogenase family protein [Amylibacter ulvae]GHA43725.1 acyl-CoA dehydrogenase [Amylibacter ulvae]
MIPFTAPSEDILFSLREVADANSITDWDDDLASDIIQAFASFAQDVIAPLDEIGDRDGCRLEDGCVRMPGGFTQAYSQMAEMGWQGLTAPQQFGGMAQNTLIDAAVSEIFSGANHAMQMLCNLVPGAITTLLRYGSREQQREWIPKLASGEALSTMCLTEAGAGSDLSQIRTKAVMDNDGWRIHGEKIFISGGDQDMSDDILHLILARTQNDPGTINGLSLFIASKKASKSNIQITRIEEKMGLHASPTCQMSFDGTSAELIGEQGQGLRAMFTMMNHARLDVALQGVAHASRAFKIAHSYAMERKQGRNPDGGDARLADHADVKRMLNEQRALMMGARAMAHAALVKSQNENNAVLVDFLTPICKVFCTQAGIRAADLGIQILGGYGYLNEYRINQTWRDARITAIYEGANGIHELSTVTRGVLHHDGVGADAFYGFIGEITDHPAVLALRELWCKQRVRVENAANPSEFAHEFAQLSGELFYRAVWVKIARKKDEVQFDALLKFVLSQPLPLSLDLDN